MKIYTRTGDSGDTALFGGGRVSKDHLRVEAYGTLDELNAVIGWAVAQLADEETVGRLQLVQHDLFVLGADLATPPAEERRTRPGTLALPEHRVREMETWIDAADEELGPLRAFILPGGTAGAAALHVARTVCRRSERSVVRLMTEDSVSPIIVPYLNRLSDLLFTLARLDNHRAGIGDIEWEKPQP